MSEKLFAQGASELILKGVHGPMTCKGKDMIRSELTLQHILHFPHTMLSSMAYFFQGTSSGGFPCTRPLPEQPHLQTVPPHSWSISLTVEVPSKEVGSVV